LKQLLLSLVLLVGVASGSRAQTPVSFGGEPVSLLRFYPNPATTQVSFDFGRSYSQGYTIRIYNFLGRKMYEAVNIGQRTQLNLSDYNRGVYVYQLFDKSGKMVESGKFQVSK